MACPLRITDAASLGLHTMVFLASKPGEMYSTKEIASKLKASPAHLSKVLQRLAKSGYVKAVRGPKGGFMIAKSPEEITLGEIYECIEGKLERRCCLFPAPVCRGEKCIFGDMFSVIGERVMNYFTHTRISDLVDVF